VLAFPERGGNNYIARYRPRARARARVCVCVCVGIRAIGAFICCLPDNRVTHCLDCVSA